LKWMIIISYCLFAIAALLMVMGPPYIAFFAMFFVAVFGTVAVPLSITLAAHTAWGLIKCLLLYICLLALISTLFFLMISSSLPDIPYAIHKNYATVEGQATVKNGTSRDLFSQRITIGETTYNRFDGFWQEAKTGRTYTLKYLPNSKIIMEIIGPLDEPEPTPEPTTTPTTMPKWKRR